MPNEMINKSGLPDQSIYLAGRYPLKEIIEEYSHKKDYPPVTADASPPLTGGVGLLDPDYKQAIELLKRAKRSEAGLVNYTHGGYNPPMRNASNGLHDTIHDPDYSSTLAAISGAFKETPRARWPELAEHFRTAISGWDSMQGLPPGSVIPASLPFSAYLSRKHNKV
jgi:hypothetical protein